MSELDTEMDAVGGEWLRLLRDDKQALILTWSPDLAVLGDQTPDGNWTTEEEQ